MQTLGAAYQNIEQELGDAILEQWFIQKEKEFENMRKRLVSRGWQAVNGNVNGKISVKKKKIPAEKRSEWWSRQAADFHLASGVFHT